MDLDQRTRPIFAETIDRLELFKALADENRLLLLGRLASSEHPLTVTEASSCCGIHISGVSRHLAILKQAGVAVAEKRGREVVYRVAFEPVVEVLRAFADALERWGGAPCCAAAGEPLCQDINEPRDEQP
jgi:DNA-binding transcriptional ArsR family regulator